MVTAIELDQLRESRRVTQAHLIEGRNLVRLYEPDANAPPGFEPAQPTLEDAYLILMQQAAVGSESQPAAAVAADPVSGAPA